jgi:hypothetical protein
MRNGGLHERYVWIAVIEGLPRSHLATFIRGVREGIRIADGVRRSTPFLSTLVGRDQRGLNRRAAIMWRIQMLCATGELPFKAVEVLNTNGTSHLLSILAENIELHIVRTEDAEAFPIDARIRQDRRAINQPDLFEDGKVIPLTEALKDVKRLYAWLAWGANPAGELTHLCLSMPEDKRDVWLARVNILHRVQALESGSPSAEETPSAPNPALLLKFRAEIARSLEEDQEGGGGNGDAA